MSTGERDVVYTARTMRVSLLSMALSFAVCSCSHTPPTSPIETNAADSAPTAVTVLPPPSSASSKPVEPPPSVAASAAPASSAPAPIASASAAPAEAPVPNVKVSNIGMHIGGGPNDDETKAPIKQSVAPHMDEFRRCYALLDDPTAKGDFGLDLHIPAEGGKAGADHPRTALKGKPFTECVVNVFLGIDFKKPRTGKTTVSYSLRFGR